MTSQEIQEHLYQWASNRGFNAPYGVLTGEHTNRKGNRYLSVTFGRARTLDATVEVYNPRFLRIRTSSHGSEVFQNLEALMARLEVL